MMYSKEAGEQAHRGEHYLLGRRLARCCRADQAEAENLFPALAGRRGVAHSEMGRNCPDSLLTAAGVFHYREVYRHPTHPHRQPAS